MEKLGVKNLIIGGGITGLSLASFLEGHDYLILEKENEIGGYCKTTNRNGFIWDYSGHFFHFKNDDIKNFICKNVECEILEVSKISRIYYQNKFIDFPFQSNIHQLEKSEFIDCLYDIYNSPPPKKINNFEDLVISKFGRSISEKFILPYNSKLYACDLKDLDIDCMGRFIPNVKFDDIMNSMKGNQYKSYNDNFIYPEFGCFEFIKSVSKHLDKSLIKKNEEVLEIDLDNKICYTKNFSIGFDNLISTIPFKRFLNLTNHKSKTNYFSYNRVIVFNLGFDSFTDFKDHWIYFPGNEIFYRVGFYNNILKDQKMSLYVEISLDSTEEIFEEKFLKATLNDLKNNKIITNQKLIDYQMIILDPAYVYITKQSSKIYADWCNEYNSKNIYSIGRYGSWTYCSIEDNIIQAKQTAELL